QTRRTRSSGARTDLLVDASLFHEGREDRSAQAVKSQVPDVCLKGVGDFRFSRRCRCAWGIPDVFGQTFERNERDRLTERPPGRQEEEKGNGCGANHPWPTSKLNTFTDGRID